MTSTIRLWNTTLLSNLSSLELLSVTGNTTWDIPERVLKLPKLRKINGTNMKAECSMCSLVKDYDAVPDVTITFLPSQGYRFRNVCTEQDFSFHTRHRYLLDSGFFPRCIMGTGNCQSEFGHFQTRNRCLALAGPIFIVAILVAVPAVVANLVVLLVIYSSRELRKKPSMMLISSLAIGDILMALSVVMIGTVYQVMTSENFQATLDQVCPYVEFTLLSGYHFAIYLSFLITIEKYLVIVHGLRPHLHMRAPTALRCICVAGVVGLVPSFALQFTSLSEIESRNGNCLPMFDRQTLGSLLHGLSSLLTSIAIYLGTFVLYLRIYFTVRRSGARMGIRREGLLMKRIGIVIGTNFLFNFFPVVFIFIANPYARRGQIDYDTWVVVGVSLPICAAAVNAFADPILYAYRTPQLQSFFRQQWNRIKPKTAARKGRRSRKTPSREHTSEPVVIVNFRSISA